MKRKINLIAFFLFYLSCTANIYAQKDNIEDYSNASYLTINTLSSLNTFSPRWRAGYIKNINDKWKIGLDIGYGIRNLSFSGFGDKIGNDYQLWEIRPELYYILKPERKTKKYFSIELFYINHTDVFFHEHYISKNKEYLSYNKANFKRYKYGFHLKYGFIIYSKKRLGFNLYSGLGLKIRNVIFSKVINPKIDLDYSERDMVIFDEYKGIEGSNFGVNLTLGFKLYYRL